LRTEIGPNIEPGTKPFVVVSDGLGKPAAAGRRHNTSFRCSECHIE